jgi:tetratricopeptide (TPR) repeat protein
MLEALPLAVVDFRTPFACPSCGSVVRVFVLTEHVLPAIGLGSAAEYVVNHYYDGLSWKPEQRDLALARIYEKARKLDRAEESFRRAIAIGSDEPDTFLFLGQFYARQKRALDAIRAFEQAVAVAHDRPIDVEFARRRIEELRRR